MFAAAFAFIAADIVTSHRLFSVFSSSLCGLLTASAAYFVLFHTPLEIACRRRDEARLKLAGLDLQRKELFHRQQSIASERQATESHRAELATQFERLKRSRSVEYQREKMFQRNWKSMRSVEFENYLEERFSFLDTT